jgi:hypothetical protein
MTVSRPRLPDLRAARRPLVTVSWLLLVQAVLIAAFVLPGYKPEAHHVPVGVVGPPHVAKALEAKTGDDFTVTRYASESAARDAIDDRDVYGALIVDGKDRRLLTASAASNTVAQMLRGAAEKAAGDVQVEDVKPLDSDDPRGATINLLFLPLISVCFTAVLAVGALKLSARGLLAVVTVFAALGGLAVTALMSEGLGALPGSYLALSGLTALTILAIALPVAGLHRLLGQAGIGIGAVLFLVIGNPASGNGTAPELLPGFWRWISQLMPPGAGGTGLRNTSYFDGAALGQPILVLTGYAVAGALLVVVADAVRRRRSRSEVELEVAEPLEERRAA